MTLSGGAKQRVVIASALGACRRALRCSTSRPSLTGYSSGPSLSDVSIGSGRD